MLALVVLSFLIVANGPNASTTEKKLALSFCLHKLFQGTEQIAHSPSVLHFYEKIIFLQILQLEKEMESLEQNRDPLRLWSFL